MNLATDRNELSSLPSVSDTLIPGLFKIELDIRVDERGWFEEVWQRHKFRESPLRNFMPVQQNISFNDSRGIIRGFHAEPWNKLVTVASGSVFCAWLDLREGPTFGSSLVAEMRPGNAYYIPAGVANAYQALTENTCYSYLVDSHWSEGARYTAVNPFDPSLSIPWPIGQEEAVISAKDSLNPPLSQVLPIAGSPILVSGSNGQLGSVFLKKLTNGLALQRDLSDLPKLGFRPSAIVNCAAYTAVDAAEKFEERSNVMNANFEIPLKLANYGLLNDVPVIHFSSDYVFNGEKSSPYSEIDPESPESVYGFSKHLGDVATRNNPRHYIIRTSWVYGESRNFVKIMAEKAGKLERVSVVDDQIGRPTYAPDIVEFALTLLRRNAPYGTYNFSGGGDPISWYELARFVYESVGAPQSLVEPVSTETYLSHNPHAAPRPKNSVLDLSKLSEFGIKAKDWQVSVLEYLALAP